MPQSIELQNIRIHDPYWKEIIDIIQNAVIPYQWEALNDRVPGVEPSYVIHNYRIAAGLEKGEYGGMVFQDSDLAKWIEAACYSLMLTPNPELRHHVDEAVELIGKAQQPDGYVDTYYIVKEPGKRWTNLLHGHELYCAGHLMEAGVAHHRATGETTLLNIVCRLADHIDSVFGPGKLRGYPGHPEVELALVRLYDETQNKKYLKLAQFFINERGAQPSYFDAEWERNGHYSIWTQQAEKRPNPCFGEMDTREYAQYHKPVREQTQATGHAVRALYLYAGMAEAAERTGDTELLQTCRTLWKNVVNAQMYVTGGVGSSAVGEAFTFDYDLPNDAVYAETCASVALTFFGRALAQSDLDSTYADVMERALFNVLPSSMQRDGHHFNYVNPLEVWPERCARSPVAEHVKPVRQPWFACACCPPNLARLFTSLGRYVFSYTESRAYLHQFVGCEAQLTLGGAAVRLEVEGDYPYGGNVTVTVHTQAATTWALCVRKPAWCRGAALTLNGTPVNAPVEKGYWVLERGWGEGDTLKLEMDIPPVFVQADPRVRADTGRVCLTRGPVVYCLEQTDNGENLSALRALPKAPVTELSLANLPYHMKALSFAGMRRNAANGELYAPYAPDETPVKIIAVPYACWGNRGKGEMLVWMRV